MTYFVRGMWVVSAVLLTCAAMLFGWHRYQWSMLNRADGIVIGRDSVSQHPLVRFRSVADQPIEFMEDDIAASVGDSVLVLYDPREPRSAQVWSFGTTWFATTLFAAIGVLIASIAIAFRRMGMGVGGVNVDGARP